MEQLKQGSKREAVYQYVDTRVSATLSEIIRALADNHKFSPDEKQRKEDIRRIIGQLVQEGRIIREDVDPPEYKTIQAKQQTETVTYPLSAVDDEILSPSEITEFPLNCTDGVKLPDGITAKQEIIYTTSDNHIFYELNEAIEHENKIKKHKKIIDFLKHENYPATDRNYNLIQNWEAYRAAHKI